MFIQNIQAQSVAIKTNILYDATTTPNLAAEVSVGKRNSIQLSYALNPWEYGKNDNGVRKVKHWLIMPEYRYWFCSVMNGWFLGVHAFGGQFNASNVNIPFPGAFFKGANLKSMIKDNRVEGSFVGGGINAGYQWILSRHWNLEAEAGLGYGHIWYKQYPCSDCGSLIQKGETNYVGLTKLGLSIMYLF